MNIAIMVCKKITFDCSGTGCFKAFIDKSKSFEIYKSEPNTNLCGFFHCNGCDSDLSKDLDYKINQLKKLDVKTIHMSKCIDVECSRYDEIKKFLFKNGFDVVDGTH
ncbi:MAG: CGGC domain-containing protein [Clostridiaceae bacterium]|nr:CGGC domain-containing protein [Clostridiaceae bacterium]